MYLLGLIAYIPATPVQGYLSLTLKRIGFSTFDSNMLSIPSAVLQIILMLVLAKSSEYFDERTLHCFIGEFWILPLLAALLALPSHGHAWARFTLTTMISGISLLPPHPISAWIIREQLQRQETRPHSRYVQCDRAGWVSVIGSQIYRKDDQPYYYRGNKVLIAICALTLVVMVGQRSWLMLLNKRKERVWERMEHGGESGISEGANGAREREGNKRLEFRFRY